VTRDDLTAAIWHAADTCRVQGPRMPAFVTAVLAAVDTYLADTDAVTAQRRALLEAAFRERRPVLTPKAEAELARWDAWREQEQRAAAGLAAETLRARGSAGGLL